MTFKLCNLWNNIFRFILKICILIKLKYLIKGYISFNFVRYLRTLKKNFFKPKNPIQFSQYHCTLCSYKYSSDLILTASLSLHRSISLSIPTGPLDSSLLRIFKIVLNQHNCLTCVTMCNLKDALTSNMSESHLWTYCEEFMCDNARSGKGLFYLFRLWDMGGLENNGRFKKCTF